MPIEFKAEGNKMSMDEDAMFKALLKKKPEQQQPVQTPVRKEIKEAVPAAKPSYPKNSEDAMYNALLKNRPAQPSVPKTAVRAEPVKNIPAAQPVIEEPVAETKIPAPVEAPVQPEVVQSLESIEKLNASVNMVYGLVRTAVVVLVLILVVGIAILVKP